MDSRTRSVSRPFRALGCCRVSTARQAEQGYSLEEQEAAIRACCERNNFHLVEVLADRAVSGRIKDRPAVRRILELADQRAFDVLIMVKVDRAGRSNRVIQEIIGEMHDRGVRILFLEGGGGDTPEERFLLNVLGGMAEYNWEQIRANTMAARRRKAQSGRVPINLQIFGYHQVTCAEAQVKPEYAGRDGHLLPIEDEARWVREIFRRFDAGTGCVGLARWLNSAGVTTKRGNRWHHNVLHDLLQNSTYIGKFIYGKQRHRPTKEQRRSGRPRVERIETSPEEQIVIPVPPLLVTADGEPDEALFYRVQQRIRDTQADFRGRPTLTWPLSGVISCGACITRDGTQRRCTGLRRTNSKRKAGYQLRQYTCGSRANTTLQFCGTTYNADRLEERVYADLVEATQPGELGRRVRALVEEQLRQAGSLEDEAAQLQAELARLDAEERKIAGLALKGFSEHIIDEMLADVKRQRSAATVRLRAVQEQVWRPEDPESAEQRAERVSARIRELLAVVPHDPAAAQRLYRQFVRVTLWPDREPDIDLRVSAALAVDVLDLLSGQAEGPGVSG